MEIELELYTSESDEIKVMQNALELARKAKELGFTILEMEIENEEYEEEEEEEEEGEEEEEEEK